MDTLKLYKEACALTENIVVHAFREDIDWQQYNRLVRVMKKAYQRRERRLTKWLDTYQK